MTREDFISSFTDSSKISLMDTILGDIYDKTQENINDPTRIIKSHLDGVVEEASHDSRLVDVFLDSYLHELKRELDELHNRSELERIHEFFLDETLHIKPHTKI